MPSIESGPEYKPELNPSSKVEKLPFPKQIQTLSIVVGTDACDARCPFCVSHMTPLHNADNQASEINRGRFTKALNYAREGQTHTAMVTGKGEPTLFPSQLTTYLEEIDAFKSQTEFKFATQELQTNGLRIAKKPETYNPFLGYWADLGLQTVAISLVHFDPEENRKVYVPYRQEYMDVESLITQLHDHKLKARLACIMLSGAIDSADNAKKMIAFAKAANADELTLRPVNVAEDSRDKITYEWTLQHMLSQNQKDEIAAYLDVHGKEVVSFPFGGIVYDVDGQNVCLTNSLTKEANPVAYSRQLIYFPNGDIATGWTKDAQLLP